MPNKIACLQIDSIPGNKKANLEKIALIIESIKDPAVRMALFCECGTTGYCVDLDSLAEEIPGETIIFFENVAKANNIWISGGMVEKAQPGRPANTSFMISPIKGLVAKYQKIHLFSLEKNNFTAGETPIVVDTELGKVGMTICYDMVFPELTRILVLQGATLIINSTFWFTTPENKPMGWSHRQTLAMAKTRALENGIYFAMACRCGKEGDLEGIAHSCIVDPVGNLMAEAGINEEIITAPIDYGIMDSWHKMATYIPDRRPDIYKKYL